jgi:hypothetical protein
MNMTTMMKTAISLGLGALLATATVSCTSKDETRQPATKAADEVATEAARKIEATTDKAAVAVDDSVERLRSERATFERDSAERLEDLDRRIAELEARAKEKASASLTAALTSLRQARLEANASIAAARAASAESFTESMTTAKKALERVKAAYDAADAELKK